MHRFSRGGTPTARQVIATWLIRTVQGIPAIPVNTLVEPGIPDTCKLYPAHFFENFRFPMVEDIINAHSLLGCETGTMPRMGRWAPTWPMLMSVRLSALLRVSRWAR